MAVDPGERLVMITGATGNLGSAVVAAIERQGARTVLLDRSASRLRERFGGAGQGDRRLLVGDVDLADEPALREALRPVERFGWLDGLVSCAGGYRAGKPAFEEDLETWDFLLRLNLRTALVASRAVLPGMLQRGRGSIVHVASRDALAGSAGAAAYGASKAALLRLTESLAEEVKHRGVRVSCVLPAALDTPQNRAAMPESAWPALVSPAAVADAIAFLVSDAARAITGAALPVYGLG